MVSMTQLTEITRVQNSKTQITLFIDTLAPFQVTENQNNSRIRATEQCTTVCRFLPRAGIPGVIARFVQMRFRQCEDIHLFFVFLSQGAFSNGNRRFDGWMRVISCQLKVLEFEIANVLDRSVQLHPGQGTGFP